MESFLNAAVEKVRGLNSVAVTTESGQLLMCTDSHPGAATALSAASSMDAASGSSGDSSSALMYFASSQLSKMKTGSVRSVRASYQSGGRFVQVNALPHVVTFYGDDDMDASFVQGLAVDIVDALRPLREKIAASATQS